MDVEDGAETALVETPKKSQVVAVCYPRLRAIQQSSEYYGSVDTDLGVLPQVFVVPDSFVESAEGAVCFGESVVYFPVDLGV